MISIFQTQTCKMSHLSSPLAKTVFCSPSILFVHPVGRLSEDCKYFAYGLSSRGSDWVTVHFMKADGDLAVLPDVLERVKFSCLAWTHDGKGIFYNCYPPQEGKADGKENHQDL